MNMKENKEIFLKVNSVEPVFKDGGICSREPYLPYLDGIKVWVNGDGHFFPCDRYTICDPDAVIEDGRRQAVFLAIELCDMSTIDKHGLFGASTVKDIFLKFPYETIREKLDAWKKEKKAIHIRDEVYHQDMQVQFVVTKIFVSSGGEDTIVNGIKKDGTAIKGLLLRKVEKTGLHVDDLDSYLEV